MHHSFVYKFSKMLENSIIFELKYPRRASAYLYNLMDQKYIYKLSIHEIIRFSKNNVCLVEMDNFCCFQPISEIFANFRSFPLKDVCIKMCVCSRQATFVAYIVSLSLGYTGYTGYTGYKCSLTQQLHRLHRLQMQPNGAAAQATQATNAA